MSDDTVKAECEGGGTLSGDATGTTYKLCGHVYEFRRVPVPPILPASKPKKSKRAMAMRRRGW